MSAIKNFILAFDHSTNKLVSCDEFGSDVEAATAAYASLESQHRDSHFMDIVLVGSDSIETVKVTHSTYFADGARDLVGDALTLQTR